MKKLPPFKNEPYQNFSKKPVAARFQAALDEVRAGFGREYPLIIGGQRLKGEATFESRNPSNKSEVIGLFQKASAEQAQQAVEIAHKAFQRWQHEPADKRAARLLRVAALMRQRRNQLAAWCVLEAGKSWAEADADVAEAIDFAEWYAREAIRLGAPQPTHPFPGEKPEQRYIPLGVIAVIPPWNFPAAILAGMTFAALVAGNTVVLKPSSDTPGIGAFIAELILEAGFPSDVFHFVSGGGASVGNTLVLHPRTRMIAFTGSKEVGLNITELAAKTQPGQIWIKRVIAEMGGKNAILVDDSADLEPAAQGATASAFGYQGQKCSAGSRIIVHEKVYDQFLEKMIPLVKNIRVGPADDPANQMGPVINQGAFDSIMNYISIGKSEGRLAAGGTGDSSRGFFIQPTVFTDVSPQARIAQEEIFGPVTAVMRARDFDDMLAAANSTQYGLTGAVYSKNRRHLEKAKQEFFCGNLYLNRKCTGAMVGAHPFGGFNMSGTDSKAGGRDYLLLFTQAKAITEKVAANSARRLKKKAAQKTPHPEDARPEEARPSKD
ncbi:MAG: L-glutamate gamma-semialdehyde dehydrogenase [Terriglobia bacterium]